MKNYKELFESMSVDEIMDFLDEQLEEKGDVPLRSNGPAMKDTGVPRNKGAKPLRDNEEPTKKGQDPVDPKDGDMDDFMKERDAREAELPKSKYMKEEMEEVDDIELEEDFDALLDEIFTEACKKAEEAEEDEEEDADPKKSPEENEVEVEDKLKEEMDLIDAELADIERFLESCDLDEE